jgi:hypothetical protein
MVAFKWVKGRNRVISKSQPPSLPITSVYEKGVMGYTPAQIVAVYSKAIPVEYTYGMLLWSLVCWLMYNLFPVAAITMIVYDSLILFNQEVSVFIRKFTCPGLNRVCFKAGVHLQVRLS